VTCGSLLDVVTIGLHVSTAPSIIERSMLLGHESNTSWSVFAGRNRGHRLIHTLELLVGPLALQVLQIDLFALLGLKQRIHLAM